MRLSGQLGQSGGDERLDLVVVDIGEERLAECGCMHRQQRPHLEQLQAGVGAEDVMDDEHAAGVRHPDADGLADARREELRPRERAGAQLVQVQIAVSQLEELRPELVLVGVEVLFDEAVLLERPQQPVDGRLREPDALGEVGEAEPTGVLPEGLENADGAVD
jgi:hypothetical protein